MKENLLYIEKELDIYDAIDAVKMIVKEALPLHDCDNKGLSLEQIHESIEEEFDNYYGFSMPDGLFSDDELISWLNFRNYKLIGDLYFQ